MFSVCCSVASALLWCMCDVHMAMSSAYTASFTVCGSVCRIELSANTKRIGLSTDPWIRPVDGYLVVDRCV